MTEVSAGLVLRFVVKSPRQPVFRKDLLVTDCSLIPKYWFARRANKLLGMIRPPSDWFANRWWSNTVSTPAYVRAGIAQSVVCWARCPAWCSAAGLTLLWVSCRGDFSLEVNVGSDSAPWNSFGWEYKPRSSLCTHAVHRTDSNYPGIYVLDGWIQAKNTSACTIHEDKM